MPVNIPLRNKNPGKHGVVGKESSSRIFSGNVNGTFNSSEAYSGFLFGRDDITGLGLQDEFNLLEERLTQKINELTELGNTGEAQIYQSRLDALRDSTSQDLIAAAIEANRNIIGDQLSYNPDFSSGSLKYIYSQTDVSSVKHDISGSVESNNRNQNATVSIVETGGSFGVTTNDQNGVKGNNEATVSLSQRYNIRN